MKLTSEDIKDIEKVGDSAKGEVFHITTKGGYNIIARKSHGGEYKVLGTGAHRSFALHQAEKVEKNIQWSESLFKSEDFQKAREMTKEIENITLNKADKVDEVGNPIYESNPQNHYDLASFHSKMAGKAREKERQLKAQKPHEWSHDLHDAQMRQLMHSDIAIKHFQMSGLNHSDAVKEHVKHMDLHHELPENAPAPFQEHSLSLAWNRANPGKRHPKGLTYKWSE